jgi:DNA-binding response OmpR family regulator
MPVAADSILLVEDDELTRTFLCDNLVADGYEVLEAIDAESAERQLSTCYPDLAIVDLGLPDRDGLSLIDMIRRSHRVASRIDPDLPIIVLSGRGTELERIRGFARGADDYVVKPFSYLELRARMGAILKRAAGRGAVARVLIGPLEVDACSRQATLHGIALKLSGTEFALLRTLAGEPLRAFSREELLKQVWGYRCAGTTRTVDTHVSRLRRKLREGGGGSLLINVWGYGYRLLDGADPE